MRKIILLAVCLGTLAGGSGCGKETTKTGPASAEDIKRDLEEQKKVEEAERGPGKTVQGKKPR